MSKKDKELLKPRLLHRIMGLILKPLFEKLGFKTEVEIDLSFKEQRVDLVTVQKEKGEVDFSSLPRIYWEAFEDLNEYNLISFKSYSEAFNEKAIEEFWGHLTNYRKINDLEEEKINLYAIVHHFPEKLFKEFKNTKFLKTIKEKEIFDLDLKPIKRIRFIVTRKAENPVLALFSENDERVLKSYNQIDEQTDLTKEINPYYYLLKKFQRKEAFMYTEEDFKQDYGFPEPGKPYWFPWEKEIIEIENKKSEIQGQIKNCKELYEENFIPEKLYKEKIKLLEQKLQEIQK